MMKTIKIILLIVVFGVVAIALAGDNNDFIGLTQAEAEALASDNNVMFRVGMQDGEPFAVTFDYRPGRVTASITDGVVSDISVE